MLLLDRLLPRSITAQITGILAVSIVFGVILVMTIVLLFIDGTAKYSLTATAARIVLMTRLTQAASTDEAAATIIAAGYDAGLKARRIAIAELKAAGADRRRPSGKALLLMNRLEASWGIDVLEVIPAADGEPDLLAVRLDERNALLLEAAYGFSIRSFVLAPSVASLTILLIFATLLSIYAVHWIISPLSALATATQSFGRSPDDIRMVRRTGPREIVQVADALNEMRTRIRSLLDDRTRMLAAISHDLRTPLTRLRLRAERLPDRDLRDGLLHEITRITHMLDETLNYLRRDVRSENMSRIDLPSLLQTVCAEFADVGHAVAYEGPPHLTWTCRPNVLARAISNVVDNAVKHGSLVSVSLHRRGDSAVEIDVSDDGPGIPMSLREKVFAPFFKGDRARNPAMPSGFGLGLSIARDVVKGHCGEIDLLDRSPRGLTVRMLLRSGQPAAGRNIS